MKYNSGEVGKANPSPYLHIKYNFGGVGRANPFTVTICTQYARIVHFAPTIIWLVLTLLGYWSLTESS